MRCTSPRTVGFKSDGKTICWSQKEYSKAFATFQLPCSKCLACRLEYARSWAIRCVHEARMWEKNSFITLTYDDEHLVSPRLVYRDFQLFMKKLRKLQNEPIGFFVTGEYGEITKRPHWHAIVFNWYPSDANYFRSNERGDRIFKSVLLDRTWSAGHTEIGSVTFDSAGYCARYAAKKLVHGRDEEHDFQPISKKSSKHAIGKKWLEKFWPDVFLHGRVELDNGMSAPVPRYYEKWLKQNHPEEWVDYVTRKKEEIIDIGVARAEAEKLEWQHVNMLRLAAGKKTFTLQRYDRERICLEAKFKQLMANLKF